MLVIAGAILGALWGLRTAARRKGNALDMAQYAAVYGIAMALAGLLASLILTWTGVA